MNDDLDNSTDLSWPKLTDLCTFMNTADHDHAIHHLKSKYHESGEKSRHFSFLDYFTHPVCHDHPCQQRGPDNRSCTVFQYCDMHVWEQLGVVVVVSGE